MVNQKWRTNSENLADKIYYAYFKDDLTNTKALNSKNILINGKWGTGKSTIKENFTKFNINQHCQAINNSSL